MCFGRCSPPKGKSSQFRSLARLATLTSALGVRRAFFSLLGVFSTNALYRSSKWRSAFGHQRCTSMEIWITRHRRFRKPVPETRSPTLDSSGTFAFQSATAALLLPCLTDRGCASRPRRGRWAKAMSELTTRFRRLLPACGPFVLVKQKLRQSEACERGVPEAARTGSFRSAPGVGGARCTQTPMSSVRLAALKVC